MKLKKIITMGLSAIMAVSAMSISAFACENEEDAVVSFLSSDGENYIYLSEEDIANGNNTVVGYDGITFEVVDLGSTEDTVWSDNIMKPLYDKDADYDFAVSYSKVPSSAISGYNKTLTGSFDIAASNAKYSNVLIKNSTNTKALMSVNPDSAFGGNVTFSLCSKNYAYGPLVNLNPVSKTTYGISATGLSNWNLYCFVKNQLSARASGTISISCYN